MRGRKKTVKISMTSGQSLIEEDILWEVSCRTDFEEISAERACRAPSLNTNVKKPCYGGTYCKMVRQENKVVGEGYENTNQTMTIREEGINEEGLVDVEIRYGVLDHYGQKDLKYGNSSKYSATGYTTDSGATRIHTSYTPSEGGDHSDSEIEAYNKCWTNFGSSSCAEGNDPYETVKETIHTFNRFYLHLLQRENDSSKECVNASKQLDVKVLLKMYATNSIMYPRKQFGHLPGIDVGYQFHSRAEMVALGFHSDWDHKVDYLGKAYSEMEEYKDHTFPLAVAIVLSVEHEEVKQNSDDVIYTALCGHTHIFNQHQVQNSVMTYSNQALKNNMEQSIPIRVVQGNNSDSSDCNGVYTYMGLYKVIECWTHNDLCGCLLYNARLRRLEEQPKLTINQVCFNQEHSSGVSCQSPGLVSMDISGGREEIPIPLVNLIDDTPFALTGFTYSKSMQVGESVDLPPNADGCNCKGTCINPKSCACARLNGCRFPYVRSNGGRLNKARDIVFECGPNCGCGPQCINRISQRGIKYHLEVFRTPNKGWAVRTRDFIPSGAPVCEYIGILRQSDELDNVDDNEYIFDIDCLHTIKGVEGRESRLGAVSEPLHNVLKKIEDRYLEQGPDFCIDAKSIGNVARFINHSCEPNLFVQCILSAHQDPRFARVVLFASENITPFQEITYDYGCSLDSVIGPDGKVKQLPCCCGTADCRKRIF